MPTVLVTGATGQQGGAVIDALLAAQVPDLNIRALTRNPKSRAAQTLAVRTIHLIQGNLTNKESLIAALRGCDAAHLVTDFRNADAIPGELCQGRTFIDAAKEVGVKHVVLSSVASSESAKAVEHFYSKFVIEKYLHDSGLSWTVVRPCGFMDLIPTPGIAQAFFLGALAAVFGKSKQKWIACKDIGRAITRALLEPEKFSKKTFTIAGDVADMDAVYTALDRAAGREPRIWKVRLPRSLVLILSPYHYRQMFEWLALGIQDGDVNETKKLIPEVLDIEAWARKRAESLKEN